MGDILKLKYKVGGIEFEAEGYEEAVEQQRINFMNTVLPAAVDAMLRTQPVLDNKEYIEAAPQHPLLEARFIETPILSEKQIDVDYSRISVSSFLKSYGVLNDQDFVLFSAFFAEKKNGTKEFSSENIKQYYQEARRQQYSNISQLLRRLVKKGYIMDTVSPEESKAGKYYMLTDRGITYIKEYVPKESSTEKKKHYVKKNTNKRESVYSAISADDLNLGEYPAVKSLSPGKEQVIMAMYIVTKENKGEWFNVDDIFYLLTYIFEVHVTRKSICSVFDRNKSLFITQKDPNNKRALQRKLLSGAKEFAEGLITK